MTDAFPTPPPAPTDPGLAMALALPAADTLAQGSPEAQAAFKSFTAAALPVRMNPAHPMHREVMARWEGYSGRAVPPGADDGEDFIPGSSNAPAEAIRPETFAVTGLAVPEGADTAAVSGQIADARQWAVTAGLTPEEWSTFIGRANAAWAGQIVSRETAEEQLRGVWRGDFDQNVAMARRAVEAVDPTGKLAQFLKDTALGDDPAVVLRFHSIARKKGL